MSSISNSTFIPNNSNIHPNVLTSLNSIQVTVIYTSNNPILFVLSISLFIYYESAIVQPHLINHFYVHVLSNLMVSLYETYSFSLFAMMPNLHLVHKYFQKEDTHLFD